MPVNGRGYAPDVMHPWLAIEVKRWNSMPLLVVRALAQAERAADWCKRKQGQTKLPVAIVHKAGGHVGKALVVMRLEDFEAWFHTKPEPTARDPE